MLKKLIIILLIITSTKALSAQSWQIVTENFPPYFGKNLADNGWLFEITQSALKTQHITSNIEFTNWDRALKLLERKRRTAVLGAFYSKKRSDIFYYSRPLSSIHSGLFKRTTSTINYDGTLDSLIPYSICKEDSAVISNEFSQHKQLAITSANNISKSLHLLKNKRVDLVATTKEVAEYWLKNTTDIQFKTNEIEYIYPHLATHKLYVIFAKSDPNAKERIQKLNKGIDTIIKNGTVNKILTKHGFSKKAITDYIHFLQQ